MAPIAAYSGCGLAAWSQVAQRVQDWISNVQLAPADVVVLVPAIEHVSLARRAWVQAMGVGLLPRIETVSTLAQSLTAPDMPVPGEHGGDPWANRLTAAQLLARVPWGREWAQRDRRSFDHLVAQLQACADAFAQRWAACPPAARGTWLDAARAALVDAARGPASAEAMLARVALEWVAGAGVAPRTDALFDLPAVAWVHVRLAGGHDVGDAVIEAARARDVAVLVIDADRAVDESLIHCPAPGLVRCRDLEDEAQRSADAVLSKLASRPAAPSEPVALVALDRLLVRRVHALLLESGVRVSDETGWKLSTTRAAAALMSWLRVARATASAEELLVAMKHGWADAEAATASVFTPADVPCVEAWLRSQHAAHAWRRTPSGPAREPWQRLREALRPLAEGAQQPAPLSRWLARLRSVLEATGAWQALRADGAGAQAVAALRLDDDPASADAAWRQACDAAVMSLDDVIAWADNVFEATTFKAPAQPGEPDVVIAALPRVLLRPFSALVMPGCDETHLGAAATPVPLLGDALARRLGLPDAAQQREAEQRAFAQALAHPDVTLLYRTNDADRALAASVLLHRLEFALARRGLAPQAVPDQRAQRHAPAAPVHRPAPPLQPFLLPAQWSATAYEALRDCPYRFAALHAMKLREDEELDETVTRREWGQWLHATLFAFHSQRGARRPPSEADDEAMLREAAHAQRQAFGLDEAQFLPWWAEFEPLAHAYVQWWRKEESAGARFEEGELTRTATIAYESGSGTVTLRGVIDRIDQTTDESGKRHTRVIDYKTGDVATLKRKAKSGSEDTQLAFYALLQGDSVPVDNLRAAYLSLRRDQVQPIEHAGVAASAEQLRGGLLADVLRITQGAGLPALGAGEVCETCAARGLCRRDFWCEAS